MRRTFSIIAITTLVTACLSKHASAQVPLSSGDARILIALPDSLIMCEGDARFATIEVAWKSDDPVPSEDAPDVRWSSTTDSVASVKSNSEISARKPGATRIIATVQWGPNTASREFLVKVLAGRFDRAASKTRQRVVCRE
jgi:hypothetical protein